MNIQAPLTPNERKFEKMPSFSFKHIPFHFFLLLLKLVSLAFNILFFKGMHLVLFTLFRAPPTFLFGWFHLWLKTSGVASHFPFWSFSLVLIEANTAAHSLASWASSCNQVGTIPISSIPPSVWGSCEVDGIGSSHLLS